MASETLRLYQPIHIESVDAAAHTAGSGYPTHSHLGVRLARADRTMHTYFRRAGSVAFAQGQVGTYRRLPEVREVMGYDLGLWQWWGTPGVTEGEWYLIAEAFAGFEAWVQPYNLGLAQPPAAGEIDNATLIVGTGVPATYGPFRCRLRAGPNLIGLMVTVGVAAAIEVPPGNSDVLEVINDTTVRVADGELAAWSPFGGPVVAFYRPGESSAAADLSLDGYHQIDQVRSNEPGNFLVPLMDRMTIWPPLSRDVVALAGHRGVAGALLAYEVRLPDAWTLRNVTHRELPQTDLIGSTAVGYVPIPDESAFSRGRFVASPLGALMNNTRHLAATRGRMALCSPYTYRPLGLGALIEVARCQVDSTPEEWFYDVALVLQIQSVGQAGLRVEWRVITTDTTAAAPTTSPTFVEYIDQRILDESPYVRSSRRMNDAGWSDRARWTTHHATEWRRVLVDAACPAAGRMLVVEAMLVGGGGGDVTPARLAGVFAVGVRV